MDLKGYLRRVFGVVATAPRENHRSSRNRLCFFLMCIVLGLWSVVHVANRDRIIYHDSWLANFPMMFAVAKNMKCAGMPDWLGGVDSGTPVSLYAASVSIINPIRLAALFAMSCLELSPKAAISLQKAQILLLYLCLAGGMYLMGRALYREHLSAVYLFAATLFAGLCMETIHSDQATTILFWLPWIVICAVKFHRSRSKPHGHWYMNAAALFVCLQALDQAPHFVVFAAGLALLLYALLQPVALVEGLRLHWKRLWPAALVVVLTGVHLRFLLGELGHAAPSQRPDLDLALTDLGVTGFAQPTSLIHSFLPFGFLVPFDALRAGFRVWLGEIGLAGADPFDYRLDVLMFFVGVIPVVLAGAFLMHPRDGRVRAGWGLFALLNLLVAMQQTGIYRLIFHVPFFNLFRSYLLLALFAIFAFLVMSGYGMDALLTLKPGERKRLTAYALLLTAAFITDAGVVLGWLLSLPDSYAMLPLSLAFDVLIIAAAFCALAWAVYREPEIKRGMAGVIVVLAFSQALYQEQVYRVLGISRPELIERFGLDAADRTPLPTSRASDPNTLTRKLCTRLAECYLSTRDTASLNRDLEGTFLRSRDEAVFQPGLQRPVVEALSAIGHPIFWTSRRAEPYADAAELSGRLNANASRIGTYLGEVVNVRAGISRGSGGCRARREVARYTISRAASTGCGCPIAPRRHFISTRRLPTIPIGARAWQAGR